MFFAHANLAHARLSLASVVWVGGDDMNRHKGHNYLTVFGDLMVRRALLAKTGGYFGSAGICCQIGTT